MNTLYVAADRSRLRAYLAPRTSLPLDDGNLKTVASENYPDGRVSPADLVSDSAGRFPTAQSPGMSIDERLPLKEEHERRLVADVVSGIERCLAQHPDVPWHFAAGPGLSQAVVRQLAAPSRARLGRVLDRNLAQLPPHELRARFAVE